MGNGHCNALPNVENCEFVGVADLRLEAAQAIAEQHQIRAFQDYRELLEIVDGVVVATPPVAHGEVVVAAAEAGVHAFCEKPLSLTLSDADAMIAASDKAGTHLMVGQVLRFYPVHVLGKQSKQQLIEVIAGAHERGVPVIVDAAAQLPPRSNLSEIVGLGADLVIFSGGKGIDLVILTANPWPAFRTAMEIVRDNGRVSVVSLLGRGEPPLDFNPLAMELFYNKGTTLIAVSGRAGYLYPDASPNAFQTTDRYAWDNIADHIVSLMADGLLEPSRLVTHRFHYSEMVEAYEMAYHREKNMLGVIFNWQE